jgi:hypothetical protein
MSGPYSRAAILPLLALLVGVGLTASTAARAERGYDPRDLVTAALEVYNERSADPLPFLTREQIDDLVDDAVIRIRRRDPTLGDEGPERVTGYVVVERPRLDAWLAALDPEFPENPMLTQTRLEREPGRSVWYQHVDLPWPITDRHWVIEVTQDVDLADTTEGFVWAHRWRLMDDGPALARRTVASGRAGDLTTEDVEDAIYLPTNEGAWIMFSLDHDLTLIAYRVRTVVGGGIPDSWITTFAMAQLEGLLRDVEERAATARAEYDPDRSPIADGHGEVIRPSRTDR